MLALQAKRERADEQTVRLTLPTRVRLLEGRFQDEGEKIKSGSVDCVFTDPPYGGDWLDQWDDLGHFRLASSSMVDCSSPTPAWHT